MNKFDAAETVERLLNLVPVLFANQGLSIKELLAITGQRKASELRRLLEEMLMFGVPPFSPADLIEIYVDDDGRVFLEMPQGLERPMELLPEEWNAVRSVLEEALQFRGSEGASLDTIRLLLERLSAVPVNYESEDISAGKRSTVEEALSDNLQLEFLYRTLASKDGEVRRVDPWALLFHHGAGYLIGYCHLRRDARSFHLDRLERLELLDLRRETTAPEDLDRLMLSSPILQKKEQGISVRLIFRTELLAALDYQYGLTTVSSTPAPAGQSGTWSVGECKTAAPLWFRTTLRSFGPGVRIESPDHLRRDFALDLRSLPRPRPISSRGMDSSDCVPD